MWHGDARLEILRCAVVYMVVLVGIRPPGKRSAR
jgi:hypothetical protein